MVQKRINIFHKFMAGYDRCRDVHHICITVAMYGGYRYGSIPWAPSITQNTAVLVQLKYSCWRNGNGLFTVNKVSQDDLNEVNYTFLMLDIHCHHETIHIWTMVWTWYGFGLSHTILWASIFIHFTWSSLNSCIQGPMPHNNLSDEVSWSEWNSVLEYWWQE